MHLEMRFSRERRRRAFWEEQPRRGRKQTSRLGCGAFEYALTKGNGITISVRTGRAELMRIVSVVVQMVKCLSIMEKVWWSLLKRPILNALLPAFKLERTQWSRRITHTCMASCTSPCVSLIIFTPCQTADDMLQWIKALDAVVGILGPRLLRSLATS